MIFDLHLHAEGLSDQDLETLSYFGVSQALVPAHAHLAESSPRGLLEQFENLVQVQLPRLARAGIAAYAALGIHPRALPRRGSAEVLSALPGFARQGKVAAVGPLGLYLADEAERESMVEQLALAKRLKLPVLVQVPVRHREALTRQTLQILRDQRFPPRRVLLDGASPRMLPAISKLGFFASLMLHPDGMKAEAAVRVVRKQGPARLGLSSRAGDGGSDILSLARMQRLMEKAGLSRQVTAAVCQKNARRFLDR